ncbi:MAG: acyl carrier protein [Chitinispirillales bacterium]|jgi:acyl carrier protein|nr:acyl carrier protein [Chitinispirillales bacterium]
MKREIILQKLKDILMDDEYVVLKEMIPELTEQTSLINDLAFDSLQIMNLIVQIEKRFEFACEADEMNLDMFENVSMLIDFIQNKLSAKQGDLVN